MIYEFRTYTLHVRTMPEFIKRFGEALPRLLELSPLAALPIWIHRHCKAHRSARWYFH